MLHMLRDPGYVNFILEDAKGLNFATLTVEDIDKQDHLTYFLKETLWIFPPAVRSLGYKAYETIKLSSGLTVPKGQICVFNIYASHHNSSNFMLDNDFIPDWFNPTSKFYKNHMGGPWHELSFIPFSFGKRGCPGRSLAMMELKIVFLYIMKELTF